MNIFFRHLKKYRAASILAPAFKLIEALFELFVPIFVADMVDRGVGNGDTSVIIRDTIIIIAFGLFGLIFSIIGQYFSAKAATGLSHDVRERTYKKMLSLPASEVDRIGVPAMITAMTSDINQMQSGVNLALRLLLRSPFVVFGALIAAMIIDVKISSVFAALIFALFAVVIIIMAVTMPKYSAAQKNLDGVSASARENLTGARVIRAFGAEDAEVKNYGNKTAGLEKSQNFAGTVSALLNPLTFAIVNLGIVALLYFGGVRVNSGALTQGKIIALYDYMSQILIELVKFANLVVTISRALACGKRIELLRQSNLLVGKTLAEVAKLVKPGVTTRELDKVAEEFIRDHGATPTFKGFPNQYGEPFPASLCTSVNEQVVHGIPGDIVLKDGDIVSVDCGTYMNGFCGDSAYTFCVGEVDEEIRNLLKVTKEALYIGIQNAVQGKRIGDIGYAIQQYCESHSYGVVREFVGHGIGKEMHEDPQVPNYGKRGYGPLMKRGLCIAIEPMITLGDRQVIMERDGWTVRTRDRKCAAHFEHTIAVGAGEADILSSFKFIEEVLGDKAI